MKHESIDSRRDARRSTYITGQLRIGAVTHSCWIRDLSAGGALIFAEVPVSNGDRMILEVDDKKLAAYVRWTDYPLLGVQFEEGSMVSGRKASTTGERSVGMGLRSRMTNQAEGGVNERLRRWWNGR